MSTPDYYPDREEALSPESLTAGVLQGEVERSPHSPLLHAQPAEQLSLERPKSIEEGSSCISDTRGNEDPNANETVGGFLQLACELAPHTGGGRGAANLTVRLHRPTLCNSRLTDRRSRISVDKRRKPITS